jgi:RNA polymerase sigma factor (sigma-70 family)
MPPARTEPASDPSGSPGSIDSTVELLARARRGDDAAIEALFARHLGPLRRFTRGRLPARARDLADTDDLVQDALLQTLKHLDGFESRHPGALQAYLRQAVMNRLRDHLRRQARAPGRVDLDDEVQAGRSPIEQAVGQDTMTAYDEALTRLRPEDREAVVGRIELGLSYDELALALDKPTADAARKAAQRALVRLAGEMRR